jgi:hypothetical protein
MGGGIVQVRHVCGFYLFYLLIYLDLPSMLSLVDLPTYRGIPAFLLPRSIEAYLHVSYPDLQRRACISPTQIYRGILAFLQPYLANISPGFPTYRDALFSGKRIEMQASLFWKRESDRLA